MKDRETMKEKSSELASRNQMLTLVHLNDTDEEEFDGIAKHLKDNYLKDSFIVQVKDGVTEMYFEDEEKEDK